MFERFTADSRQVVLDAQAFARRLGHRWIGTEHLLYALAASQGEIGEFLRGRDVTPQQVEQEFVRLIGPGHGALDRDAPHDGAVPGRASHRRLLADGTRATEGGDS